MKKKVLWAAFAGGALFLALAGLSGNRADYDTFIYLNFGRALLKGRTFLRGDVFSYLPTYDTWVFHEWLSGVVFYAVYKAFGPAGLQVWKIVLGLATAGAAWAGAVRRGGGRLACLLIVLGAECLFCASFGTIRAQIFSFLFLVATLSALEEVKRAGRLGACVALIPLFCLWANLHGGFLAGVGAAGVYLAAALVQKKPARPFLIIFLAGGLATLLNPYGPLLWERVLFHSVRPDPRILEWFSIPRSISAGINLWGSYAFIVAGLFAAYLFAGRIKKDLAPVMILAVFYAMGFMHVRHMALFALAFAVYAPAALPDAVKNAPPKKKLVPAIFGLLYLPYAFIVFFQQVFWLTHPQYYGPAFRMSLPPYMDRTSEDPSYPVEFVRHATDAGLAGKLAAPYPWGAFLSFMLGKGIRVGVDGRSETVFPETVRESAHRFFEGGPGWRDFIEKYPPDMVLLMEGTQAELNMEREPGWKKSWHGSGTALFVKAG